MLAILILLLGVLHPAHQVREQNDSGAISGTVVDIRTNLPIDGARVRLIAPELGIAISEATNASGQFAFSTLAPGRYFMVPERDGYFDTATGENGVNQGPRTFVVQATDSPLTVRLSMGRAGVIAGSVRDEERSAVEGALVQAMLRKYDNQGRELWDGVQEATTDDQGDFRLFGLRPGRYVISATPAPLVEVDGGSVLVDPGGGRVRAPIASALSFGWLTPDELRQGYAPIYYPNTPDWNQAATVDVGFGDERFVEVLLSMQSAFSIRGTVVDPFNGQRRPTIMSLSPRTPGLPNLGSALLGRDGEFEFFHVAPGVYDIDMILATNQPAPPPPPTEIDPRGNPVAPALGSSPSPPPPPPPVPTSDPNRLIGTVEVTVGREDVEDVVIVARNLEVSGTVRTADGDQLPNALRVVLVATTGVRMINPNGANLDENGAFTITHVPTGEFRVDVRGLPAGWYVDSAKMGIVDISNTLRLRVDGTASQPLELVLARSSNLLSILARGTASSSVPAAFVVAVPSDRRLRTDLYRTGWTDEAGFASLAGIAPGDYWIFAWEYIEDNAWLNLDYMSAFESRAVRVPVGANQSQSVEVRLVR